MLALFYVQPQCFDLSEFGPTARQRPERSEDGCIIVEEKVTEIVMGVDQAYLMFEGETTRHLIADMGDYDKVVIVPA